MAFSMELQAITRILKTEELQCEQNEHHFHKTKSCLKEGSREIQTTQMLLSHRRDKNYNNSDPKGRSRSEASLKELRAMGQIIVHEDRGQEHRKLPCQRITSCLKEGLMEIRNTIRLSSLAAMKSNNNLEGKEN